MKAIILAAGVGSRLRPITESVPKTLVPVGGRPILSYQIDALLTNGITDIVICTGYKGEHIDRDVASRYPDHSITTVPNVDFATTNNMYSLYLAREHLRGDVLIMNGDVCFEADVVERLLQTEGSAVAVDVATHNDESMKVVASEFISDIAKTIPESDAFGCSIDVYKFVAEDVETLAAALVETIEGEQDRNQWTEVLLQQLFATGRILARPCAVSQRWFEIDDHADLNRAEKIFNPRFRDLATRRVFFFDGDGTLALGETVIEGADRLLQALDAKGIPYYVLTNNSSRTAGQHVTRMSSLPISVDHMVVSTDAAVAHLRKEGITRILLCATESVTVHMEEAGFTITADEPQAALLTYNNEIDYAAITALVEAVQSGIPYFATHTDLLYPYEGGFLPDIGCLINMIASATGRSPDLQFGKPNPAMVAHLLDRHGVEFSDTVVVGDRLYTDIALAEATDMVSVMVLSGETDRSALMESPHRPDIVLESVADLIELFD